MQFTQIPNQFAPLGGEAVYAFAHSTAATIDIRIAHAADGTPIGAKRFAGVTAAAFDAAPYLRRAVRFDPAVGGTGFGEAAGRMPTVFLEAVITEPHLSAASPVRTYLPTNDVVQATALLTAMPRQRVIAHGECDELTLLTDGPLTVSVTAAGADSTVVRDYSVTTAGLHLLRVDTRDFPGARTLSVDAGACGAVEYSLLAVPEGAKRLAWRTAAGSVEHYTFPVVQSETVSVRKKQVRGAAGRKTVSGETERRTRLVSAYESPAVIEALAELIAAPDVWLADGDDYTRVDVVSDQAVVHRQGAMGVLEIEIRTTAKICPSWN